MLCVCRICTWVWRTLEACVVKRPNVCLRFQMCSLVRMVDRKSSSTGIFPCNVSAQRAAECVRINQCINTTLRLRCPPSPDVSGPISLRRLASLCCKCTIIPYRKIAFAILGKNHAEVDIISCFLPPLNCRLENAANHDFSSEHDENSAFLTVWYVAKN